MNLKLVHKWAKTDRAWIKRNYKIVLVVILLFIIGKYVRDYNRAHPDQDNSAAETEMQYYGQ